MPPSNALLKDYKVLFGRRAITRGFLKLVSTILPVYLVMVISLMLPCHEAVLIELFLTNKPA